MTYPYDDALRRSIADRCATFPRAGMTRTGASLKRAAVAIALVDAQDGSGEAAFLLTRRASSLRAHGGQWALPGGRCEEGETPAEAVLRELEEEIGLALGVDAVLGVLDDYPTRSGYLIAPVVVWVGPSPTLRANPSEVASIHRIGLTEIAREDAVDFVAIAQSTRRVVQIRIRDRLVHAPTAALLYQFRELLAGRITRVADLEQPVFAWR